MFESARIKLTAWYLLIIMIISGFFSVAFYQSATDEVQHIIDKIKYDQEQLRDNPFFQGRDMPPFALEELQDIKRRILVNLLILNGVILVMAGGAGYFLAGRTLRPIKVMMDEQNQFISSASHELRTPIATMQAEMEASLLEKNITDKQARGLISSNLEELTTLKELTNSLLRLAHVHTSQVDKDTQEIHVSEILQTAQKKVTQLAKKKNISFKTNIKEAKLRGDKKSLTEVFVILLDNAIKYSPEKSTIEITSKKTKGMISVSIIDQGIGIAAKDIDYIFDRFYRADKSRSQAEGYGLGLSIAKRIVVKHNGSIDVTSRINAGTIFTVSLPQLRTS